MPVCPAVTYDFRLWVSWITRLLESIHLFFYYTSKNGVK
jgi:hypothetical protein